MANLLVVSRSMAIAMRLSDDHDVVEHPADAVETLEPDLDTDVVVIDLGPPTNALMALDRLRSEGHMTPVLLVSGYQPQWAALAHLELRGVHVVPLPITRDALLTGVAALLGHRGIDTPSAGVPVPTIHEPSGVAEPLEETAFEPPQDTDWSDTFPDVAEADGPDQALGAAVPSVAEQGGHALPGDADQQTGPPPEQEPPGDSPADADRDRKGVVEATPAPPGNAEAEPSAPATSPPRGGPSGLRRRLRGRPVPAEGRRRPSHDAPPGGEPTIAAPPGVARPGDPVPGTATPRPPEPAGPPTRRSRRGRDLIDHVPPVPAAPGHGDATAPHPRGDSRLPEAFVAFTQHAEATAQAGLERATISALVAAMTDRGSEVYGVADTAQVLADDVVERADADAAAILVPDEGRWRVAGGVGLRPVERRHILNDKHWLIQETALGGRALLIGDTDVVRPQLTHAPLAAWQHLLAVPIPGVRVVVLLARGNESPEFTEEDLAAIAPVAAEAADLIRNALAARRLARMLGPLREEDTPVLRRSH